MIINKKKSGIILHQRSKRKRKKLKMEEFEGIPVCRKYKYLGVELNEKADCKDLNEKKLIATERSMKTIQIMNL